MLNQKTLIVLSHCNTMKSFQYTNRLCTRSLRCPQHTDEQRATVRSLLLPFNSLLLEETGLNIMA